MLRDFWQGLFGGTIVCGNSVHYLIEPNLADTADRAYYLTKLVKVDLAVVHSLLVDTREEIVHLFSVHSLDFLVSITADLAFTHNEIPLQFFL